MERGAHEPGLDELPVFPEGLADVVDLAVDADRDLELGRGHDLGLDSANVAHDADEVFLRCLLSEVLAVEPERKHLSPAEIYCGGRARFGHLAASRIRCGRG